MTTNGDDMTKQKDSAIAELLAFVDDASDRPDDMFGNTYGMGQLRQLAREIERLQWLVKEAYIEGYDAGGNMVLGHGLKLWRDSDTRKALDAR